MSQLVMFLVNAMNYQDSFKQAMMLVCFSKVELISPIIAMPSIESVVNFLVTKTRLANEVHKKL